MDTSSILPGGAASSMAQATQKRTQLTQEEFFKVLTAQLTEQDPMKPMDSQDFLGQLVQLQNLQVTADLSTNFAGMLSQNALSSAGALLGKVIRGTDAGGAEVTGFVNSVSVDGGKVKLLVGSSQVLLGNVSEILDPASLLSH